MTTTFATALGAFAINLVLGLTILAAFVLLYTRVTPPDEFKLIRDSNSAAAISLAGAVLGFGIVLSRAVMVSEGLIEVVVWGVIGLAIQIIAYRVAVLFAPKLSSDIEAGNIAASVLSASLSISFGLLNAACMTP